MPSGATGKAIFLKQNGVTFAVLQPFQGTYTYSLLLNDNFGNQGLAFRGDDTLFLGSGSNQCNFSGGGFTTTGNMRLVSTSNGSLTISSQTIIQPVGGSSYVPLTVQANSGQTADVLDFNSSTGATSAKVDKNFNAQFAGYSQAVRTVAAADTASLADSLLLINGAYAETLPTTTNPTGRVYTVKEIGSSAGSVTNTIDGTAGYSLSANQYVTVIWSGSALYKIGGN